MGALRRNEKKQGGEERSRENSCIAPLKNNDVLYTISALNAQRQILLPIIKKTVKQNSVVYNKLLILSQYAQYFRIYA